MVLFCFGWRAVGHNSRYAVMVILPYAISIGKEIVGLYLNCLVLDFMQIGFRELWI